MSKKVILMVDNSAEFLATRAEYVRAAGFSVLTAATPDEARQLAHRKRIDLAVIDLRLLNDDNPGDITGLFLAEELHPRMKVIMNTLFPEVQTALSALRRNDLGESAADDYIGKADGAAVLITAIKRLCAAPSVSAMPPNPAPNRFWQTFRLALATLTIIAVIVFVIMGISWNNAYVIIVLILTGLQVIWAVLPLFWQKK